MDDIPAGGAAKRGRARMFYHRYGCVTRDRMVEYQQYITDRSAKNAKNAKNARNTECHSCDFGVFVVLAPILIGEKEIKKNIRKI